MDNPKPPQEPSFIFEQYKGYTIVSHRNNVPQRHNKNIFIFGPASDFPKNASIVKYDASQPFGRPETSPHNIEDIKAYIDRAIIIRKKRAISQSKKNEVFSENKNFPELLHKRIKLGQLPTVIIAGHLFYADARNDLLRPKNDFMTMGIRFSDIDHYFDEETNTYLIPYNPKKHEFQEPDYDRIISYPKDLIAIKFPHERVLDPVGWNRREGFKETEDIIYEDFKLQFKAQIVPWNKTALKAIIAENRERLKPKKPKKQGRRI